MPPFDDPVKLLWQWPQYQLTAQLYRLRQNSFPRTGKGRYGITPILRFPTYLFHLDQGKRARLHLDIDHAGELYGPLALPTVDIKS